MSAREPSGPTGLDVAGRRALVLGGDAAAAAEVGALLDAGAVVSVVAVQTCAAVDDLADRGLLTLERRAPGPDDLAAAELVVRPRQRTTAPPRSGRGRVTLVGGGPGDPDLVTLAGRDALRSADLVVADRLAPLAALRWVPPHAEVVDVGKVPGGRSTSQEEINRLLVEGAAAGRHVVRFKGGDAFVFGRGGEEAVACARAGVEVRVVPGVSSSVAGPAAVGIPVTHRGVVHGFTVVSGHVPPDDPASTLDWAALARLGTTIVVLMGVRTLDAICTALVEHGLERTTPAAVVADATLPSQRHVRATVSDIAVAAERADIGPPAVAVIGEVADLAELPWS